MKYLAAYLLLNATGVTPSADKVKSVLESVAIDVDEEKISSLLTALEGKSVEELITEGNEKLASVPSAAPASAASASADAGEAAAEEAAAEEEEESDDEMGFGLFD
ncbi:related to 60S acidic ribosomal protein P2 [Saccharomycodes ludwigii]|uniref:Related to 60S acidic ribosomal protein P2 n=1 Tax=Saccharomycodes ludwigii TaxID=36035 RepID=A0A376BAG1_9ASCO|nr:hypothetical protein SCDLUD_000496 [Saccharomycodes ludwigii]KAH3902901.1 hypothetical protein SCDLUD_000496 [Saccharomycodes ludwigii]SSD61642.1 related to 60S acidic ribosomal protein P2 [Saccharomycodes ludwigii]